MMARQKAIKPLVHDDGTNNLKKSYLCEDCKKTFRAMYNFGVHRACKHGDWSVLEEWAEMKGIKLRWKS